MSEKYIKEYKTITSSNTDEFDKEINFHLKNGWEILDNSHSVNVSSSGDINVHVKVYKDNSDDYETSTNSNTGYTSTSFSQVLVYKDELCYDLVFFENGMKKERNFNSDYKQNGIETHWYENGSKKTEVKIKNGQKNGIETDWYENGIPSYEVTYKNGLYHGLSTSWDNGVSKITEGNWKDGKRDGTYTRWNVDGQIISQKNYNNDILEGEYLEYYDNGKLKIQTNYSNDYPEGEVVLFFEEGSIHQKVKIKKGKLVNNKRYNINGEIVYEESYKNGVLEKIKNIKPKYEREVVINKDKSTNQYILNKICFNDKGKISESKKLILRNEILSRKFEITDDYRFSEGKKFQDFSTKHLETYEFEDRRYHDDGKTLKYETITNFDTLIEEGTEYYESGKKEIVQKYKLLHYNEFSEPELDNPSYYDFYDKERIEYITYDKKGRKEE